ncbi:hypothetical protein HF086_001159 [Spodoptera exigua]|uniref:Uncharacterized protein n=1 Tax=Spodoptera exigua TaxID=7107 RepID=A0A922M2L7_SPOEX|nr:hypothetical protein HF086_001159 [Spodoptera exigua]
METACTTEESGSEYDPDEESNSSIDSVVEVCQREPSKRTKKTPVYYQCQNVSTEQCEPVTYKEAMMTSDSNKWKEAIDRDLSVNC